MIIRTVIVTLAASRFLRALQHETIGEPIRNWVDDRYGPHIYPAGTIVSGPLERRDARRAWIHELLTCDLCLGFWVTVAVTLGWRIRPARVIIEAAAAAALVSAVVEHYPNFEID